MIDLARSLSFFAKYPFLSTFLLLFVHLLSKTRTALTISSTIVDAWNKLQSFIAAHENSFRIEELLCRPTVSKWLHSDVTRLAF